MELTSSERKRLKLLLAWHEHPPTWRQVLPKGIGLVLVGCVIIVALCFLTVSSLGSTLVYYGLGLITFLPLLMLNLISNSVRRWRINEAIIDWNRVAELLSSADRSGG